MVNKLKNALANTTIQEDDQQFITNITILLEYTTMYMIPIVAGFLFETIYLAMLRQKAVFTMLYIYC